MHLYVKGSVQSFSRVRGALAGHPLRVLKFHCQCVAPPLRPPPSLTPPSVSPRPSAAVPSVSPPSAVPPPSVTPPPSVSPPRSSSVCLLSSTLRRKRQRQEYSPSPSPPSEDSDETRLPPSPPHVDSDETTLDHSPTPSQRRRHFSPELFDSPTYSDTTIPLYPPRSPPVYISRVVVVYSSGDTTPELSPRPSPRLFPLFLLPFFFPNRFLSKPPNLQKIPFSCRLQMFVYINMKWTVYYVSFL